MSSTSLDLINRGEYYSSERTNIDFNLHADIQKEKKIGVALIAIGITLIVVAIFGSLLCLGLPSSIPAISSFIIKASPLVHALLGGTAILTAALGIFCIYKGSKHFKIVKKIEKVETQDKELQNFGPMYKGQLTEAGENALQQNASHLPADTIKRFRHGIIHEKAQRYDAEIRRELSILLVSHREAIPSKINKASGTILENEEKKSDA